MKICVIGAGAMGCLYGARLHSHGHDVVMVDRWEEHVAAINEGGLRLLSETGDIHAHPLASTDPSSVTGADLVIVQVDANSTTAAGVAAAPMLAPGGFVLTLQNGIGNLDRLDAVLGRDRVAGGLSYSSCEVEGPARVRHTYDGPTWLGARPGQAENLAERLEAPFDEAGLNPHLVPDIELLIVEKWILNSAINALCAITGLRQGEIPRCPELEIYQDHILDEAFAVVAAQGHAIDASGLRAAIKAQCWKKFNKPSMLQHIEAARRTEIDALNGAIARAGETLGVPTPYNDAIALLIKGLEKNRMHGTDGRVSAQGA